MGTTSGLALILAEQKETQTEIPSCRARAERPSQAVQPAREVHLAREIPRSILQAGAVAVNPSFREAESFSTAANLATPLKMQARLRTASTTWSWATA